MPLTRRALLVAERQPRGSKGPFTDLVWNTMDTFWERVRDHLTGLEDTVWSTCRHTFASRLVQQGRPMKAVALLMGNTTKVCDEHYAHLAPDHLKDAVDVLEQFGQTEVLEAINGSGETTIEGAADIKGSIVTLHPRVVG